MLERMRSRSRANALVAMAVALTAALGVVGCGSDDDPAPASTGAQTTTTATGAAETAAAFVEEARQRDTQPPDDTSRPAEPGKQVAIVTIAMANESGSVPAEAAVEAAKELGWEAKIYDAKDDIAAMTALVRQAITTGADAIVVNAIDCALAKQAFQEAKAKGIPVVGVNAFDCDDEYSLGGPSEALFAAPVDTAGLTPAEYWTENGRVTANAAIADSDDTAKIISVENHELAGLRWMAEGFDEVIEGSEGSEVVARVVFTTADFASGKVVTMVQSALTKNPDATYVKSPFTAASIAVIAPAVKTAGREIKLLGGEGLGSELELIRGGGMTATAAISGEWLGWAAIDTVNSALRGEEPVDSGLQWVLVDEANVPESGSFTPKADFRTAYRTAWGIG